MKTEHGKDVLRQIFYRRSDIRFWKDYENAAPYDIRQRIIQNTLNKIKDLKQSLNSQLTLL